MSSVALYRTLIVDAEHAALADAVVETFLEVAAQQHNAVAFGTPYPTAMVYFAAHLIQRTPGLIPSASTAAEVGPVISQKDGDLSRTYAAGSSSSSGSAAVPGSDEDLRLTAYGLKYLGIRGSRSSSGILGVSMA